MKVLTIGRSSHNNVPINDLNVSRCHCQLVQHDDGTFSLADLDSKNGTFVNGRKVHGEVKLNPTDVVRIGNTILPWVKCFEEENNALWQKAASFEKYMNGQDFTSFKDLMCILSELPLLEIRNGYVLDAFKEGEEGYGWEFRTYCHKKGAVKRYTPKCGEKELKKKDSIILSSLQKASCKIKQLCHKSYNDTLIIDGMISWHEAENIPPILPYFKVPYTEDGIMQAWLLNLAAEFMPKFWHANYSQKTFIFDLKSVRQNNKIWEKIKDVDVDSLLPDVIITDDRAYVEYAYWNEWTGLVKVDQEVIRDNDSVSFLKPETKVLVEYNCGIMY